RAVIVPPGPHPARDAAAELNLPVWEASLDAAGGVQLARIGNGSAAKPQAAASGPRGDDVALFLHTSGTTSRPKGVPLTHANLMASARNIAGHYRLTPEDTSLVVMPLFHVHGLIGATLSTFLSGGSVVVPDRFSAGAFWPAAREPGTVGPGTNVDVGVMDEAGTLVPAGTPGEVVIRGPNVTRGYQNNPEANAASFTHGWFRTGDRGVLDADGYLTLIGRLKE